MLLGLEAEVCYLFWNVINKTKVPQIEQKRSICRQRIPSIPSLQICIKMCSVIYIRPYSAIFPGWPCGFISLCFKMSHAVQLKSHQLNISNVTHLARCLSIPLRTFCTSHWVLHQHKKNYSGIHLQAFTVAHLNDASVCARLNMRQLEVILCLILRWF